MLHDYETAPVDERLRATLHFLATLEPARALAAGVTKQALRDAADVQAGFEMITRFADAVGAAPHSAHGLTRAQAIAHEGRFFDEGYGTPMAPMS